jgi:hypothetical protein
MKTLGWELLGTVSPRRLTEARLQLHHAVQLVAAVGRSLVPARGDDGHTSLEWRAKPRGFMGQEAPGARPWSAALSIDDLSLLVLAEEAEAGRLALRDRTKGEAFAWLVNQAHYLGASAEKLSLDAPYTVPQDAVGAVFTPPGDGSVAELGRWFGNAHTLLRGEAEGWAGAAPVRVWPHHFDIGSVLPFGPTGGEGAPSIVIGLSPGDETIPEPYFYVTPWPVPATLPDLPAGGHWHREGWTGAVLTGSEVVAAGGGQAQGAAASAFLTRTDEALRARHDKGRA